MRLFELTGPAATTRRRALQERLLPLAKLLGSTYGVPGLKAALELAGVTMWALPPLGPLDPAAVTQVADALSSFDAAAFQEPPRAHVS